MKRVLGGVCLGVACAALAQEKGTLEKPYVWARDKGAITLERQGSVFVVTHTGKRDWSLGGFPRVAAKPGDIFEITCRVRTAADGGGANAGTGVILRDEKGAEMTGHRILTPDRCVQQTTFANGVTANFGDKVCRMADGTEIQPLDVRTEGIK